MGVNMITKKKFMDAAAKIKDPIIRTFSSPTSVFMSQCFTLVDKTNPRNNVYLGGCQLLNREYAVGNVDDCIARIEVTTIKFNRWLEEAKNEGSDHIADR